MSRSHKWSQTLLSTSVKLYLSSMHPLLLLMGEKDKGFLCLVEVNENCDNQEVSPPSAKRALFQTSSELVLSSIKDKKNIATSSSEVTRKGKLD